MRIAGRWQITEAELWDSDALNLVAPAFIEFAEDGSGSFGFIAVPVRWWDGEEPEGSLDGAKARLGRLRPGEQFAYTFGLGDNWQHLCTVAPQRADPLETLGIIPVGPLPCWGWGDIPA